MKTLFTAVVLMTGLAVAEDVAASAPAPVADAVVNSYPESQCERLAADKRSVLGQGAAWVGLAESDFGTARRVCAQTEVGLGGRGGAIIDTPNFYGHLAAQGVLYGSYALSHKLEIFGTLEMVEFNFAQNASLKQTSLNLGHLTVGATRHLYGSARGTGAVSARLLLPTSFGIANARLMGVEAGHLYSFSPASWGEVHTYLGVDFTAALSAGPSQPRVGVTGLAGFQYSPTNWFGVVVDVMGRYGAHTALSPSLALRFRIIQVAVDLSMTMPLIGSDRHLALAGLRVAWVPSTSK